MGWKASIITLFLCCTVTFGNKKSDEDSTIFSSHASHTLQIEHAFGPDDSFSPRGHIIFKTSRVTTAFFKQDVELSDVEVDKLLKLVEEDKLYFIRSPTKIGGSLTEESTGTDRYVSTFVRACYLYGSSLSEVIKVAVDNSGNVIGLNIVSPRHDCSVAKGNALFNPVFNSTVLVHKQVPGAVPDTHTFIKKIENEKAEETAGQGKDNKPQQFFAKYWMYIVPVVLLLTFRSQAEPEVEEEE